jgi:DNA-binding SARP family transcriptional activator
MPRYYLRTLGELALVRTDHVSDAAALANSKTLLIPAFLATRPDRAARRVDVAEMLWPDADRPRALRALRQGLFFLSAHADEVLRRTDDALSLDPDVVSVDLWEFDRAVTAGDHARAIELARGPFASGQERKVGSEAEHWIEGVNTRVAVALDVAYVREIERALEAGDAGRAAQLARAYAARNPLDERRQVLLARTLLAGGDQVGALQTLEAYRQVAEQALDEDLPPELEDRLRALRDDLHRGPLGRPAAPSVPAPPASIGSDRPSDPLPVVSRWQGARATVLAAGGTALLALALLVLVALPHGSPASADALAGLDATLLGVARAGNTLRVLELSVRNAAVAVTERKDLQPTDLPSPDERTVATTVQAPQGWNLAVRAAADTARALTDAPGDEFPVEWSPDGRYLVYAHRRLLADGRTQSFGLGVVDLVADTAWPLAPGLGSRELPTVAWSPDGTRIAFTADVRGVPDVFVLEFDGATPRNLTAHGAWDGDPSWSPDAGLIAFASRRGGHAHIYRVRADGAGLERLTSGAADEGRPLWLSTTALAMLVGDGEERELRVLDTFTGRDHRVDDAPRDLVALAARPPRSRVWLDRLVIAPRVQRASPGQYLALEARAMGPTGEPFPEALPVTWSVGDPGVARLDGPGLVRILSTGRARIVASAAGWRRDTLTLLAVPLAERTGSPVFVEDWTGGLDRTRWRTFGDPPPLVRPAGGRDGAGVFLNRGDAFFASGAVTRDAYTLRDGLSVEVDGRMRFTGKLHQEFAVALYDREHPDSTLASGAAPALVEFRVSGPSGDRAADAWIATPDRRVSLPLPTRPGAWHRFALQVLADGGLELIVDGRMLWRSDTPPARRPDAVWIGLGSQSYGTEIAHGRLRIDAPPRYYLPAVTPDPTLPPP